MSVQGAGSAREPVPDMTVIQQTAHELGKDQESTMNNLLAAYSLKDTDTDKKALRDLAGKLGLSGDQLTNSSAKSLQLIAEQRFQQSSSKMTLFSNLMDRLAQMKQQLINNMKN